MIALSLSTTARSRIATNSAFWSLTSRPCLDGQSIFPTDATHAPRHNSHHESESNVAVRDYLHAQSRLMMTKIIELARALDAVPEEGGTLLDHTVLVYVGDNGETHHASGDLGWMKLANMRPLNTYVVPASAPAEFVCVQCLTSACMPMPPSQTCRKQNRLNDHGSGRSR